MTGDRGARQSPGGEDDPGRPEPADRRRYAREMVDTVLSDGFMIFLALLMLPIIGLTLVYPDMPGEYADFLTLSDLIILGIFVTEYVLKLALARDRWKHFKDPWHLLDLLIILLPVLEFVPFLPSAVARRSPLLRLARIARLFALSGRTVRRRLQAPSPVNAAASERAGMAIKVVDRDLGTVMKDLTIDGLREHWETPSQSWIDISCVTEHDLERLSGIVGIPNEVLSAKLVDESYPRIDYLEKHSLIFLLAGHLDVRPIGTHELPITRTGLLVVCSGRNIMTISKQKSDLFEKVLAKARKRHRPDQPLVVLVLYCLLERIIGQYKHILRETEKELLTLEAIPRNDAPRDFLETAFQLKKEVSRLNSGLLHMREVLQSVVSKRVPLEGFDKSYEELFDILLDETVYLHETSGNDKEELLSLMDLHISRTSYDMNKVMKVIAIITSLAIIPAFITGMLGMNLSPGVYYVPLWEVVALTIAAMLGVAYIFAKLGWFRS